MITRALIVNVVLSAVIIITGTLFVFAHEVLLSCANVQLTLVVLLPYMSAACASRDKNGRAARTTLVYKQDKAQTKNVAAHMFDK